MNFSLGVSTRISCDIEWELIPDVAWILQIPIDNSLYAAVVYVCFLAFLWWVAVSLCILPTLNKPCVHLPWRQVDSFYFTFSFSRQLWLFFFHLTFSDNLILNCHFYGYKLHFHLKNFWVWRLTKISTWNLSIIKSVLFLLRIVTSSNSVRSFVAENVDCFYNICFIFCKHFLKFK